MLAPHPQHTHVHKTIVFHSICSSQRGSAANESDMLKAMPERAEVYKPYSQAVSCSIMTAKSSGLQTLQSVSQLFEYGSRRRCLRELRFANTTGQMFDQDRRQRCLRKLGASDATHEATCLEDVLLETHTHAQNHPDSTVKSTLKYLKIITCGILSVE